MAPFSFHGMVAFRLVKITSTFSINFIGIKGFHEIIYLVVEFVNDFYHIHAGLKLDNPLPKLLITRELFMPKQWIGVFFLRKMV